MKIQFLILPLVVVMLLGLLCWYWVYEYASYEVAPRVSGQDGRPQVAETLDAEPRVIEGNLRQFDGTPSEIVGSWPMFRGPGGDAVIKSDIPLARKWPSGGPTKLWQVQLGQGYAAPAVHHGCVYVIDYDMQAKADAIRCFSLAAGKEIWRYSYPVTIKRNHGMSRTIPAINENYIVTIGPKCHVTCLDAKTGEFKWMIDLVKQYGTKVPLWYAGQCPLIVDNQVILAPAGKEILMLAVDCETGDIVWECPNDKKWKMTHCSILPMRFAEKDFYVYPGSRGVAGISAEDGTLLWQTDAWYLRTNVPTPVNVGQGRIFLSAGYNKGSLMLQLQQQQDKIVPNILFELTFDIFGSDQQTPIYYKGYIYGVRPDKQLVCLDMTGQILWTSGSQHKYGLGAYMIADGMIYIIDDDGLLSLIEAIPDEFRLLDRAQVLDGHECWGPPALVAGRLLVRDLTTLVCLDVAAQ